MESALHSYYLGTIEGAKNEVAFMAYSGTLLEVGYVDIGYYVGVLYGVG